MKNGSTRYAIVHQDEQSWSFDVHFSKFVAHKERTSWSLPWNPKLKVAIKILPFAAAHKSLWWPKMNGEGPRRAAAGFQCVSWLPALPPGERVGT
jgi:hypothetical protein